MMWRGQCNNKPLIMTLTICSKCVQMQLCAPCVAHASNTFCKHICKEHISCSAKPREWVSPILQRDLTLNYLLLTGKSVYVTN